LVGLAAYDLDDGDASGQLALMPRDDRTRGLETTIDKLVARFGSGIVRRAVELDGSRTPATAANLDFLDDPD
jgi:hypothetical protein